MTRDAPINPTPPTPPPAATDQTPAKIRGMFSAITPTYDRLNILFSGTLDRRWRARAAREALAGLEPCRRLLDVATGTGDLAGALARRAGREARKRPLPCHNAAGGRNDFPARVIGLDFTRAMLRRAAQKFSHGRFNWIEGDGLRLPVGSGAVDAVTVAFGLRNMADKPAALRELARVVRPGGRVVILEFSQPRNRLMRSLYDAYSFTIMPRLGRWLSGSDAYLYLAGSIRSFWGPAELSEQMLRAGLGQVRAIPLMLGVVYLHLGVKQ